jgi:hypothetical protein
MVMKSREESASSEGSSSEGFVGGAFVAAGEVSRDADT